MFTNYLPRRGVKIPLESENKPSVITELVDLLCEVYNLRIKNEILAAVLEREEILSTGVGYGIAIPHAKMDDISSPKMVAGLSPDGIEFDSVDGKPARIFFLLISPKNGSGDHVHILSELSRILNNPVTREEILKSKNAGDFIDTLKKNES
ncbi:PTS fructose transporter subunit IIA [bacterium]|nr:MAG: PTS fructose transporter subunit IIA [bacterium]